MTLHRTAAGARLQGDRSTAVFRVLLDTLARPGMVQALPPGLFPPGVAPALALPLALADLGTSFCIASDDEAEAAAQRDLVALATDARHTIPYDADIVVLGRPDPEAVGGLRSGSDELPEAAAKLAVQVEDLGSGATVVLDGPGVAAPFAVTVGAPAEFMLALCDRNERPPAGIDTWIVDRRGRVLGLPRTTRITVLDGTGTEVS
ncbi:MAG: phosphonate C-P lyase system protein PhnH [Acidimicrobiales bacterium]|nr:phosphonate C-P lyase system protein PhnH [Acidimicrobiales bacterium]